MFIGVLIEQNRGIYVFVKPLAKITETESTSLISVHMWRLQEYLQQVSYFLGLQPSIPSDID